VALGNRVCPCKQRTLEILAHKLQRDDDMADAQPLAMETGKGNLTGIMVAAIVERHG
jgi:hypothetical protein